MERSEFIFKGELNNFLKREISDRIWLKMIIMKVRKKEIHTYVGYGKPRMRRLSNL